MPFYFSFYLYLYLILHLCLYVYLGEEGGGHDSKTCSKRTKEQVQTKNRKQAQHPPIRHVGRLAEYNVIIEHSYYLEICDLNISDPAYTNINKHVLSAIGPWQLEDSWPKFSGSMFVSGGRWDPKMDRLQGKIRHVPEFLSIHICRIHRLCWVLSLSCMVQAPLCPLIRLLGKLLVSSREGDGVEE